MYTKNLISEPAFLIQNRTNKCADGNNPHQANFLWKARVTQSTEEQKSMIKT
jgi:uncharacterized protein involved in tolerance to divalent cations